MPTQGPPSQSGTLISSVAVQRIGFSFTVFKNTKRLSVNVSRNEKSKSPETWPWQLPVIPLKLQNIKTLMPRQGASRPIWEFQGGLPAPVLFPGTITVEGNWLFSGTYDKTPKRSRKGWPCQVAIMPLKSTKYQQFDAASGHLKAYLGAPGEAPDPPSYSWAL